MQKYAVSITLASPKSASILNVANWLDIVEAPSKEEAIEVGIKQALSELPQHKVITEQACEVVPAVVFCLI